MVQHMSYYRPTTLPDALGILASGGVKMVAGATDVFPATTAPALSGPTLDLTGIAELSGITKTATGWRIGATTTWDQVAKATLPPAFAALQQAAADVGSPQIQNSATVAGNLCNASPAADGVPPLLVLDAAVELSSVSGTRQMPIGEFLQGVRQTALEPGEILTAVLIPEQATKGTSAFEKLGGRKYLVISICMVAARIEITDRKISAAAISVGSCSPVAQRLPDLEAALLGCDPHNPGQWEPAIAALVTSALSPIDDIRANASYRMDAAIELTSRAIRRAIKGGT